MRDGRLQTFGKVDNGLIKEANKQQQLKMRGGVEKLCLRKCLKPRSQQIREAKLLKNKTWKVEREKD